MQNTLRVLFLLSFAFCSDPLGGQTHATVVVEENLRAEPQGTVIGRLPAGTRLSVVRTDGRWMEVELSGWIWTQSIQPSDRPGFDLAVSSAPSENLRREPSGDIVAVLLEGALLERVEERAGWTRVRRIAWAWGPSLSLEDSQEADPPRAVMAQVDPPASEGWWQTGPQGAPILAGPDGDTLATASPETELQLLARQGNWIRVRLEGWTWAPGGVESDSVASGVVTGLTPEEIALNPEAYRGQVVSWELQFISQEEAERVRTDFYEGEPFLLTRAVSSDRAFIYVAIPPERLSEVDGLIPLERIRVVGRIRTGAASLTGSPILDLLELTRL